MFIVKRKIPTIGQNRNLFRVTEGIGDKVNNAKAIDALILTFVTTKLDGTTQRQDRY
jgi:hypothetical protein